MHGGPDCDISSIGSSKNMKRTPNNFLKITQELIIIFSVSRSRPSPILNIMKFGPRPQSQLRQNPGAPYILRRNSITSKLKKSNKMRPKVILFTDHCSRQALRSWLHIGKTLHSRSWMLFFKQLTGNWRGSGDYHYCNCTIRRKK